jgi:peptide-methionine (R)-S-oxide reductase
MFAKNQKVDFTPGAIGRRSFIIGTGAAAIGLTWWYIQKREPVHAEPESAALPKTVTIVQFSDSGVRMSKVSVERVTKSEEEWKKQLPPSSFEVTRHAGTERPYTNENPNNHAKGVFRCICCDTALFDSSSLGMVRTAVSCRLCDGHLGHVFDDGPRPTGLRYCMNSVAMRFAKAS